MCPACHLRKTSTLRCALFVVLLAALQGAWYQLRKRRKPRRSQPLARLCVVVQSPHGPRDPVSAMAAGFYAFFGRASVLAGPPTPTSARKATLMLAPR